MNPFYKLNKTITYVDHEGRERMLTEGQLFHWNSHRFVTTGIDRMVQVEIARSKVNAAGARMIPCDSTGKPIDLSPAGPDIEMPDPIQPERKFAYSS